MTSYIPRTPSLDFITSNPATDAFTAGQKAARQAELDDLKAQGLIVSNAVDMASAPTKLRKMTAEASNAESDADVSYRTRDSRVARSGADASLAGTNASVAAQTAPYKVSEAASGAQRSAADANVAQGTIDSRIASSDATARTAGASADVAQGTVQPRIAEAQSGAAIKGNEATVSTATVPEAIEGKKVGLRQQRATALNTEMESFYKSLELLNAGRVDEARAVAAASGHEIPDQVIQNADVRAAVTRAAARAKEAYPDRPADQQTFIQSFIGDIANRRQQGQPANSPTAPYEVPGAPKPPEDTTKSAYEMVPATRVNPETGQPEQGYIHHDKTTGEREFVSGTTVSTKGGGVGRNSVFQQKQTAWLEVHPGDTQGALDYASGRRALSGPEIAKSALSMAQREVTSNFQGKFGSPEQTKAAINKRAAEIAQQLQSGFGGAASPAVPGAAPAPAAGRAASTMKGSGNKADPFQAQTQADIDWFKANAQPGEVIIINGKPFTK